MNDGGKDTTLTPEYQKIYAEELAKAQNERAKANNDKLIKHYGGSNAQIENARYKANNDAIVKHYLQGGELPTNDDPAGDYGEDTPKHDVVLVTGGGSHNWSSPGNSSSSGTVTPAPEQAAPTPTVEDRYKALMEAANERLKQAYDFQQERLKQAQGDAFREAFIKQQMVQRAYPEQLAAAGINGGAAQGVLARNNANYANQRTSIWNNYLNGMGEAGQAYQQGIYGNNVDFLANMAAYHQAQEEMAKQYEYEEKLARLKASLG